jgi:hypothetical protein
MKPKSRLNFVERLGLQLLLRRTGRKEPHLHRWPRSTLSQIRRIEIWTIGLAALSGAISGGILGGVEIWLNHQLFEEMKVTDWWQQIQYWSIFTGLTVLVSGIEIVFLYWNLLHAVARIGSLAGLHLSTQSEDSEVVAIGLALAALDLPNTREPVCGIDPYARTPRWKLRAHQILYRLKIGATSFLVRVALRRILARAALRLFIPLIAIPVFAVWNAVITWWIMREVRIRTAGPLAVQELRDRIAAEKDQLDEQSRRLLLEAIGEAMIRRCDAHPNFVLLLTHLFDDLNISPESLEVNWDADCAALRSLAPRSQDLLLTTLAVAAILAGHPRRTEKRLMEEAHAECGHDFRTEALGGLYRHFFDGRGLNDEDLEAVGAQSVRAIGSER